MFESLAHLVISFPYAIVAGLLISVVCAVFGVFVIPMRISFIGIALSEIAACGVAGALLLQLWPIAGALVLTLAAVILLASPFESRRIPREALMGILFVGASSLSILLVSRSGLGLHEVRALLYGDLILTTASDMLVIAALLVSAFSVLLLFFRPMFYSFLDR